MGHRIQIENIKEGSSILEKLQELGEYILAPCGGNGTCGKCRVRFVQDPPVPSQADLSVLTKAEIEDGVRLACRTAAADGAVIEILEADETDMEVAAGFMSGQVDTALGTAGLMSGQADTALGTAGLMSGQADTTLGAAGLMSGQADLTPGNTGAISAEGQVMAAVDIGTTTIAISPFVPRSTRMQISSLSSMPQATIPLTMSAPTKVLIPGRIVMF